MGSPNDVRNISGAVDRLYSRASDDENSATTIRRQPANPIAIGQVDCYSKPFTVIAPVEQLVRASDPEPVSLIVSSVPHSGPGLRVGTRNRLHAVPGDPAQTVPGLRAGFRLDNQDEFFAGAPREKNMSVELVRSPASELATIKSGEAAALYAHPQKPVTILCYAEYR
jgi:hypothetical protein